MRKRLANALYRIIGWLAAVAWLLDPPDNKKSGSTIKTNSILLAAVLCSGLIALSGCAHMYGKQSDISNSTNGTRREITTTLKGTAFFSSAQTLSRFRASQTDKSQSFNGEDFQQQGNTNTVEFLRALAVLLQAAPK